MNTAQTRALALLQIALRHATDSGLLDVFSCHMHPDAINQFCDVALLESVTEKGAKTFTSGQKLNLIVGQPVVCNGMLGTVKTIGNKTTEFMIEVNLHSVDFAGSVFVPATYPNCIPTSIVKDQDEASQMVGAIEVLLSALRHTTIEPLSVKYSELIDIEVRPAADDDRVLVGRKDWGFSTIKYTKEGLEIDVCDSNADTLHMIAFDSDDLVVAVELGTENA